MGQRLVPSLPSTIPFCQKRAKSTPKQISKSDLFWPSPDLFACLTFCQIFCQNHNPIIVPWYMLHSIRNASCWGANNITNRIHKRSLTTAYSDYKSFFNELLDEVSIFTIHQKMPTEIYEYIYDLPPTILGEVLK